MLSACCRCCGFLVLLVVVLIGVFNFAPVNNAIVVYSGANLNSDSVALNIIQTTQLFATVLVPCVSSTKAVMIACVRTSIPEKMFLAAYGWKGGKGIKAIADPGRPGMWYYSHEVVVQTVNDEKLERFPDFFIASDTEAWVKMGAVPEGFFPIVINFATNDPEHVKRRGFMDKFFGALNKPPSFDLAASSAAKGHSMELVASAVVKSLFDFYPDKATLADIIFWVNEGKQVAVNKPTPMVGPKLSAAFHRVIKHVEESNVGKEFLIQAKSYGFADPHGRLNEMLFISMFAGIGGTTDTVDAAEYVLNSNSQMPDLFWKDPQAFIKETARLYPAVAGMAARAHEDASLTLGNGRKHTLQKGEFIYNWNAGANVDPTVFGGPENSSMYTKQFDTKRPNLDRMMTFNGEIGNILKCGTSAGCKGTAARPCPGARLALHVSEMVLKFILMGEGKGAKTEL